MIAFGKFFITTAIGRGVLYAAGGLIGLWAFGAYKERSGYNACKAEWVAAEAAAVKKGEDDRRAGESDAANNDGLRDPYNRDNQ